MYFQQAFLFNVLVIDRLSKSGGQIQPEHVAKTSCSISGSWCMLHFDNNRRLKPGGKGGPPYKREGEASCTFNLGVKKSTYVQKCSLIAFNAL